MHALKEILFVILVILALVLVEESCFVVTEWEHAVVTRFGNPVKVVLARVMTRPDYAARLALVEGEFKKSGVFTVRRGPGVYFKTPFIERVKFFESRANLYMSGTYDIVTGDKKKIHLDNFALWRIENPLLFWQTVQDDFGARGRLDAFVFSNLRNKVTKSDFMEIVRTSKTRTIITAEGKEAKPVERGREDIQRDVTEACRKAATQVGIHILDVRIRKADLPQENELAVYQRMAEERRRMSKQYRADGLRVKAEILGDAEREARLVRSQGEKEAQKIMGAADAEATGIYAQAYSQDKEFYTYTKSLETLEKSLATDTSLILGLDKGIFRLIKIKE